jgi:hypothetical protein
MSLNTLANYAEILGAATIVTGLLIGWFQVRYYRAQQRNSVAINLMQTFYSGELMKAIAILQPLPDGVSLDELQAKGNEYVQAAITVSVSFETMAWAVFKRMATMDMVLDSRRWHHHYDGTKTPEIYGRYADRPATAVLGRMVRVAREPGKQAQEHG